MRLTIPMSKFVCRLRAGVLAALALGCIAQPAAAQRKALFEEAAPVEWKEAELRLPAYPSSADLIPIDVRSPTSTRFLRGDVINPNETLRKIRDWAGFDGTGRDGY